MKNSKLYEKYGHKLIVKGQELELIPDAYKWARLSCDLQDDKYKLVIKSCAANVDNDVNFAEFIEFTKQLEKLAEIYKDLLPIVNKFNEEGLK